MRQELTFYDYEFNVLGRTVNVTDIYHKELYNGIGNFEAGIMPDEPMARILLERDFTVAVWEDRQAVITSTLLNGDDNSLRVYGRTPNWLLAKRSCPNFGHRKGTPFELAHALVDEVWGDSIVTGPGRELTAGETTFWRNVYNPLSEVVADCLDRADGGHRIIFDAKKKEWRFETYLGTRTNLLYSEDRRNIYGIEARRSVLDYFNGGFYLRDNEEESWEEIASDKEGIYRWTTRLDGSGESSARSDLSKRKIENEMNFSIISPENGDKAGLGDIVRAEIRRGSFNRTADMRVVAIERWAERGSSGERPLLKNV